KKTWRAQFATPREAPIDLIDALKDAPLDDAVLVDCITMWLTNLMLADQDTDAAVAQLAAVIPQVSQPLVLVSNEIGQGVVPDTAMGRQFSRIQGRANQVLAATCDTVVFVTAGLPNVLKGSL
ncbi:MAG: bifunctional adenosylcobinamide kinase/adenosylcobinamide-phosphate guanylyltransferase, partial [Pseudomonadota bacterium]